MVFATDRVAPEKTVSRPSLRGSFVPGMAGDALMDYEEFARLCALQKGAR